MDPGLGAWRRELVARHLAACAACRADVAEGHALAAVLDAWSDDVPEPPPGLEADTLRRMRLALADEAERGLDWRRWLGVVLTPLAVAVAVVLVLRAGSVVAPGGAAAPAPTRIARPATPPASAPRTVQARVAQVRTPSTPDDARPSPSPPPPDLLARPDLFIRLPMIRHLDKLQQYEAVEHAIVDEGAGGAARDESHG